MGTVNAVSTSCTEFADALRRGECGIRPIERFSTDGLNGHIAGEVPSLDSRVCALSRQFGNADRVSHFAALASAQAVADAGLGEKEAGGPRTAVIIGSGIGGLESLEAGYHDIFYERKKRLHPMTVLRTMGSSPAALLSIEYGATGPCLSLSTACAAGAHAIGVAFQLIRHGQVDLALAGGSEAPLTWGHLKAWEAMRMLSPDGCRPFSLDRRGLVLGEGAGVFVLEAMDHARARGAPARAELLGFAMNADANDMVNPSPRSIAASMIDALGDAGIDAGQVDYINAHGTATRGNDVAETTAIRSAFGTYAEGVSISSTKSMHGHCLGATGAIEAIAAVLAIRHGFVPPTLGLVQPDPECDLDYTPHRARSRDVTVAMSNSFAFGGMNAVLVFRRA
jgi:nodulation protein E